VKVLGFPCRAKFRGEVAGEFEKLRISFAGEFARLNPEDDAKMMEELKKEYEEGNNAGTD